MEKQTQTTVYEQQSIFEKADTGYTRINKVFTSHIPDEGLLISEAFGVGEGRKNVIADILIPDEFDILYVTGESGSGKTTIIKEYAREHGYSEYEMSDEEKRTPLFLIGGSSEEEKETTLRILTSVGLSDAVLWLNTYEELSDSQQARCRIAASMLHCDVIIADEFLSTLDRETAYPVAYSIQKAIRKYGKRMIAATAHTDLEEYLMPDVTIKGSAFPSRWSVTRKPYDAGSNPVLSGVVFEYGTKETYREAGLGELHYKGKYVGGTKEYLYAYRGSRMVGVLVSTYNMHSGGRRISRVVVHPSYRGCGVGKELVRRYIKDYPETDVVAAMAMYNPVFDRAGMMRVADTVLTPPRKLVTVLSGLGFDEKRWGDKGYLDAFTERDEVREEVSKFGSEATAVICPGGVRGGAEDAERKIRYDAKTASRVLFFFRPRRMAHYVNATKEEDDEHME